MVFFFVLNKILSLNEKALALAKLLTNGWGTWHLL
jgi:hypothetical protein